MEKSMLSAAVYASFIYEINALKPGNVSKYAAGHDMTWQDFATSARITTPILVATKYSLGERIKQAVEQTWAAVGCNTNLGMLLLFAPLIVAAERLAQTHISIVHLKTAVREVLQTLTATDSQQVFAAIRRANPGGLGHSLQYDVTGSDSGPLLAAMRAAADRDRIAAQYANDYMDVFHTGYTALQAAMARWQDLTWASVACYLSFLTHFPDSHIQRKFGRCLAEQITTEAIPYAKRLADSDTPQQEMAALLAFDLDLKARGINPGSSADLTAASILVYHLTQ